jgi:dihydrolipoamide dehydrogenase
MYDLIVIGAGPGGYVAAERAGKQGMKVLLVEKAGLGGVCLNEGCIPTKTLLNAAKRFDHARNSARFGIHVDGSAVFSMNEAQAWKRKIIEAQAKGITYLMKKHGVEVLQAEARLTVPDEAAAGVHHVEAGGVVYEARTIIIAAGSSPSIPNIPGAEAEAENVGTSTDILNLDRIPGKLVVIGGGVIGLEFASLFSLLGTEVQVIEMLPEVIPGMDPELARLLRRGMDNVTFHLSSRVTGIAAPSVVHFEKNGKAETAEADYVLMAVGRTPNCTGLGLKEAGVAVTKQGIAVNDLYQTSVPGIYAIGDVIGKSLYAHAASRMAETVIGILGGRMDTVNYDAMPWAVYTQPEAAGCGLTEAQAAQEGFHTVSAKVPMRTNGRYTAENGFGPGLCKVVADQETQELLGVQMVGGVCSEIIYGAAAFIQNGVTVDELRRTVFPHPSVSEVLREALLALDMQGAG